jgi:hypothetical protein
MLINYSDKECNDDSRVLVISKNNKYENHNCVYLGLSGYANRSYCKNLKFTGVRNIRIFVYRYGLC